MDRKTVLWSVTIFFGSFIVFGGIQSITEDSPAGVSLGLQAVALGLMIAAIVLIVRKRR